MITIVVPMKNEPRPEGIIGRIHEVMTDVPEQYEVIVVIGDKEKKPFSLFPFPHTQVVKTYGDSLERSILNGFSHAAGRWVVVMDADGSHPPENIPRMWNLLHEYEMVVGSRFVEGAEFETGLTRRVVTALTRFMAWSAGTQLRDPMSGFFAVRMEAVDRVRFKPLTWKTALEIELKAKPTVIEIPINFTERRVGKSNTSLRIGLKILWELAWFGWEAVLR